MQRSRVALRAQTTHACVECMHRSEQRLPTSPSPPPLSNEESKPRLAVRPPLPWRARALGLDLSIRTTSTDAPRNPAYQCSGSLCPPRHAAYASSRTHRPREDRLVHPADPSRSNLAAALPLLFEAAFQTLKRGGPSPVCTAHRRLLP
jgi:hypothetical protein